MHFYNLSIYHIFTILPFHQQKTYTIARRLVEMEKISQEVSGAVRKKCVQCYRRLKIEKHWVLIICQTRDEVFGCLILYLIMFVFISLFLYLIFFLLYLYNYF